MQMTQEIITALNAKYNAEKAAANANLAIFFQNPVGVGEHPDVVAEADKLIDSIAHADGKIHVLNMIVDTINKNAPDGEDVNESGDNRK